MNGQVSMNPNQVNEEYSIEQRVKSKPQEMVDVVQTMSLGLIRRMNADLKPSLIDLEDCDKSTGRKREQRERLSEKDIYCDICDSPAHRENCQ